MNYGLAQVSRFSWWFHTLTKWLFVMGAVNYHDGFELPGKHIFLWALEPSHELILGPSWNTIFLWVLLPSWINFMTVLLFSRINFMAVTSTKYRHKNTIANLARLLFSWRWPSWTFATKKSWWLTLMKFVFPWLQYREGSCMTVDRHTSFSWG